MDCTKIHYPRKLAGLYTNESGARTACATLLEAGLSAEHIELLCPGESSGVTRTENTTALPGVDSGEEASARFRTEAPALRLVRSLLLGAATGLALAAVVDAVLYIGGFEGFLLSLIGPLAVAVYGTSVGAVMGAVIGLRPHELGLISHIEDALAHGHYVVVAHLATRREREDMRLRLKKTHPPEILVL